MVHPPEPPQNRQVSTVGLSQVSPNCWQFQVSGAGISRDLFHSMYIILFPSFMTAMTFDDFCASSHHAKFPDNPPSHTNHLACKKPWETLGRQLAIWGHGCVGYMICLKPSQRPETLPKCCWIPRKHTSSHGRAMKWFLSCINTSKLSGNGLCFGSPGSYINTMQNHNKII